MGLLRLGIAYKLSSEMYGIWHHIGWVLKS